MNACLSGRRLLGKLLGKWIWYMLHGCKLCCLRLLKELCIYIYIFIVHWFHMPYTCEPLMCHPFVISFIKVPSTLYFCLPDFRTYGRVLEDSWHHGIKPLEYLLTLLSSFRFLRSMILCSWDVSCFSLLFLLRKNTIGKPSPRGSYPWQFLLWELRS